MTLEELIHSDKDVLTPAEIASVLRSTDQTIRVVARQRPDLLGFPTIIMGTRVRIPRIPFLKFMGALSDGEGKSKPIYTP